MRIPDQVIPRATSEHRQLMSVIEITDQNAYAKGIQITLQNDFHYLKEIGETLDKMPLTPNFDPTKSNIGPTNGFWMKGVDIAGDVVFTQAARMYDCSNTTLALLHQSLRAFYSDPVKHAEEAETCVCDAPATHFITGQVCYHGELWLNPKYRAQGLPLSLSKLLMALVLQRWAPDYLFGMAQPGICTKGVGACYGYRNMQPHGMIWTIPSSGTLDEWVIWNDLDDIRKVVLQP